MKVWISDEIGRSLIGELPPDTRVEVFTCVDAGFPSDPGTVEFWSPKFLSTADASCVLEKMPRLRVVQLMSAGADAWVGRIPTGVTLCDARGVHDSSTAEWAITAMLAYVRDFPAFIRAQGRRQWVYGTTGELAGKRVLIVGAGSIGSAIARRLAPFEVSLTLVARTARDGVHGVDELPALLPNADIVVLVVPLTPATTGLVDAAFLAAMPDGALFVNAARGPIVDTAALTAELATGRLAAAVDVTDPEPLPADHPLWGAPNFLLTPHIAGSVHGFLPRAYRLIGEQVRRFAAGQPLENVVTDGY